MDRMLASEAGDLGSTPNGSTTLRELVREGWGQGQGWVILVEATPRAALVVSGRRTVAVGRGRTTSCPASKGAA